MNNFWDSNVWTLLLIMAALLISLLVANILKKTISFLNKSLIPTSVLAGIILLIITSVYKAITGISLFDTELFGGNGTSTLEIITYHGLGLGFIAMTLKESKKKFDKQRTAEIFNTGVTTVSTYLVQALVGLLITIGFSFLIADLIPASGIILCFGYGQGTGQALNYGSTYQEYGLVGGRSFGLTIAALGFLSASIGGVIYLNVLKKKGKIVVNEDKIYEAMNNERVENADEIPTNGSIDKMTVQVALIIMVYAITYGLMYLLSLLVPAFKSVLFGLNFLFGVLVATLFKLFFNIFRKKGIIKKKYVNSYLMNRISGFAFDLMIVAGIAAIQLDFISNYWYVLLILGVVGALVTFIYVRFVSRKLFKDYWIQQFFAMYGMLTGTASTGMILLREVDNNFESPVSDNLVYQNLPAIVFGFPMMLIAAFAPENGMTSTLITLGIVVGFLVILNIILFRSFIFKKKKEETVEEVQGD